VAKIRVPRTEVCDLLGLPVDVDEETLQHAIAEAVERQKSREALSAAEQEARAEDRRLVAAAFNDGRIVNCDKWINALAADRTANRALMASLAPGLPPAQKVPVDPELDRVEAQVMARLGPARAPSAQSLRTVAAAGTPPAESRPWRHSTSGLRSTGPAATGPLDDLGLPIPGVPDPVRIQRGTPPEQWTQRQQEDFFLRQLGPRFYPGTQPPPQRDVWYQPSPNDVSEFVETTDGQGYWREKPNEARRIED
jgi:hypothetical protein